jgi:YcaO-like protein with predicted kinase domain
MEAIELYHAERIDRPLRFASWNELRFAHDVVDVGGLPRTTTGTFHADRPIPWIAGIDLVTSTPKWVPFELVHTNYTVPALTGSGCFVMSSNGLASGNHPLEAISHGLCEVIERDATTLFYCKSSIVRDSLRVDLDTVTDGACRQLLELYERAGIAVGVWDVTSDVGIAAFLCVVLDRETSVFHPIGPVEGMGCHLVREIALMRALTEAAQARLTLIAGCRDDVGRGRYAQSQNRDLIGRFHERLLCEGGRPFQEAPTQANESLEGDVGALLTALQSAGLQQVVTVDLSRPEFGIPVFRVVVPGLEAYHHIRSCVVGARATSILKGQ